MSEEIKAKIIGRMLEDEKPSRMKLSSNLVKQVKDWKTGESYTLKDVKIKQTGSDLQDDGSVLAHFKVESAKAN